MKLKYLEIKNIGVLTGIKRFDFLNQLTVIYGPNFSGKSTIANAMYYALCGKLPLNRLKPTDLLMPGSLHAYVKLGFEINGNSGFSQRNISKKSGRAKRVVETSGCNLPNLDPDQWRLGYFLKEEEIGDFLSRTPSNRRDLMYRLLGIDQLMSKHSNIIKARILAKREEKKYNNELSLIKDEFFSDKSSEIKIVENDIELLGNRINQFSDHSSSQNLINEIEDQKLQLADTINDLKERVSQLHSGYFDGSGMLARIHELEDNINNRANLQKQIEKAVSERSNLAARLDQTKNYLNLLKNIEGNQKCPLCKQLLSEEMSENLDTSYNIDIRKLEERLSTIEAEEQKTRTEFAVMIEQLDEAADLKTRVAQIRDLEEIIANNEKKMDLVKRKLNDHVQSGTIDINEETEDDKIKLQEFTSTLSDLLKEQALYQRYCENKKNVERKHTAAVRTRLKTELLADSLDRTLQSIIGTSLEKVEDSISKCLNLFSIFQDHSGGFELEKSWLMPNINNRPFQLLSGSEKTILLIGLKIAIAKLMPGGNFFVMDNPLLHLDQQRQHFMEQYIVKLSKYKQIVLLTNNRDFADQFGEGNRYNLI